MSPFINRNISLRSMVDHTYYEPGVFSGVLRAWSH